jgi:FkbM family methyltransferase
MNSSEAILFHIGGKQGDIGEGVLTLTAYKDTPIRKLLYLFEADLSDQKHLDMDQGFLIRMKEQYQIESQILPYCVSDHIGEEDFYIHSDPRASSVFPVEPRMKTNIHSEDPMNWESHCGVAKIVRVKTTTLDDVCRNIRKQPDFLSMDAQGSEYSILKGSQTLLEGDLLGVFTEVEFREIYKGQPLFADQDQLLRSHEFIFFNFYNSQQWFMGPKIGKPFFTVGEVIYMRDYMYFVKKYGSDLDILFPILFRLAICSSILVYTSYSYTIIDYINQWGKKYEEMIKKDSIIAQKVASFYP